MNEQAKSPRTTIKKLSLALLFLAALILLGLFLLAQLLDPTSTLPIDSGAPEKECNLYENPVQVRIDGYDDDCMEPFITGDGGYLLFNNSNSALVETHIHLCKKIGENHFQHLGLLAGSVSKSKDMAPTIDADGNLFYTCLLTYEKDGNSIYCGKFADEKLQKIIIANGKISPNKPAEINMDCDISKDGNILILSRAHFANYLLPPDKSDLAIAEKTDGKFSLNPQSQNVLSKLNTDNLEYAPCQTSDQLELYFTRASKKAVSGNSKRFEPYLRIMVARRKDRFSPYEEAERIAALTGFIEAPTLTDDKREMFFHKKINDKFRLFRAIRSSK
jgi:hypothetical protein